MDGRLELVHWGGGEAPKERSLEPHAEVLPS